MSAKLISLIGPPAVGKTTLAENLVRELARGLGDTSSAELIREDYAGNPFLAASYAGVAEAQLPGQLYFLFSRVSQLAEKNWPASGVRVSDYGFCQDRLYARLRLDDAEFQTYECVVSQIERQVRPPDVLLHLDAAEPTLLERIARRGRGYEAAITADFLRTIRRSYNEAVAAASCPVIHVACDRVDVRSESDCASLLCEIRREIGI
jgi:deoxyadenosine/deoxycytidine kinase